MGGVVRAAGRWLWRAPGFTAKSPYAGLEEVGTQPQVVNAHHVKQVPWRKTDIAEAPWLAFLARPIGSQDDQGTTTRVGTPEQVLAYASKRLKASDEALLDALDGELSDTHRFVASQILEHIEALQRQQDRKKSSRG